MNKDVKENISNEQKDLNRINLIYHIIYDNDRFKMITRKYFEIFRLKGMPAEEISLQFEDFLYRIIYDKLKSINSGTEVKKLRSYENMSSWKLKQRWAKMALDSLDKKGKKYLKNELDTVKNEYIKTGRIVSAGVKTPEELLEIRKDFLEKWTSNNTYNICDYPYLQELSESKISSAFTHDILICITEVLKNEYDFDINKIEVKTPPHLAPGIFLPITKGKKYTHINVKKNKDSYLSEDYQAKSFLGIQTNFSYEFSFHQSLDDVVENLKLELINQETEKRALPKIYLDKQDLEIIRFVYTYSHMHSFSFYLGDLIKYLGLSDGKNNYVNIRNRLLKLPYYTFYVNQVKDTGELKSEMSFNLFSRVMISKDENDREFIEITKSLIKEVEKVNTDIMYKNELKKLTLVQSINLAYFLEGKRYTLIAAGENIRNKSFRYNIEDIKFDVHLSNKKTLKQNMDYLEAGFNEIKENQFIIKDYKRGLSHFDVFFYEDVEKRKLLINNTILSLPDYIVDK